MFRGFPQYVPGGLRNVFRSHSVSVVVPVCPVLCDRLDELPRVAAINFRNKLLTNDRRGISGLGANKVPGGPAGP